MQKRRDNLSGPSFGDQSKDCSGNCSTPCSCRSSVGFPGDRPAHLGGQFPESSARAAAGYKLGKLLISALAVGCFFAGLWHTEATSTPSPARATRPSDRKSEPRVSPIAKRSPAPTKTITVLPSLEEDDDSNGRGKFVRIRFKDSILTVEVILRDPASKIDRNSPLVIQLSPKDGMELSPPILTWAQFPKDSLISLPIAYRNAPTDTRARIRADISAKICARNSDKCQRLKDRVDFEFIPPRT